VRSVHIMKDDTLLRSKVTKMTPSERKQFGKHLRSQTPREDHSVYKKSDEERAMLSIIEDANKGRIHELIPIRYGRMLASPFSFYRGTAALMAYDLNNLPRSNIELQICGDCHILNFGAFATPERNVIVDINDFDETIRGPWEWDVKRLAASFVLAARSINLPDAAGKQAAVTMVRSYKESMLSYANMTYLDTWYSKIQYDDFARAIAGRGRQTQKRTLEKAELKSSPKALLDKYTEGQDGGHKFKEMPPLLYHVSKDEVQIAQHAYSSYLQTLPEERRVLLERYETADIARKVVGIGSVGTLCAVLLMKASKRDFMILQIKEARPSALQPYVRKSPYIHQGQRVVVGQRIMQSASDIFLGWTTGRKEGRQFFIRQLRDVKLSVIPDDWDRAQIMDVAKFAGLVLAKAHARSGDPAVLSGYMGKSNAFEKAIAKFSVMYADQTELDFEEFSKACRTGRLKCEREK
jgi:uncharacterized protein (DUF2252 family)